MSLPEPGKPFGSYLVDAPVGQGGMGAVYRARDSRLGRAVALKVMLPAEAADPESRARFVREARLAAALEHPGIVRVYEVGEIDGTPYIAMEWIDGKTLRATKVADPNAVLERIAETLAFAHSRGVIHRDLKPANVIIDVHGDPKLVDFGIAKRVAPSATFATQDGMVLGTPQYMAPEQMVASSVDARADQYSWGVMAYELLTGERPGRPALAHAALDERHGAIVMRALSVFASDRFASMDALLEAWRPPRAVVTPPSAPSPTAPPPSNRLWLFGGAAALSVLLAGAGLVVLHRMQSKSSVEQGAPPASVVASATPPEAPPEPSTEPTTEGATPNPPKVASAPATSKATSKAEAVPAGPRATGMVISVGVEHVYREDGQSLKEVIQATYTKCVVGMPLKGKAPAIRIQYTVFPPPTKGYVNIDGYGERDWPPPATVACLERETLAVSVHPASDASAGRVLIDVFPR